MACGARPGHRASEVSPSRDRMAWSPGRAGLMGRLHRVADAVARPVSDRRSATSAGTPVSVGGRPMTVRVGEPGSWHRARPGLGVVSNLVARVSATDCSSLRAVPSRSGLVTRDCGTRRGVDAVLNRTFCVGPEWRRRGGSRRVADLLAERVASPLAEPAGRRSQRRSPRRDPDAACSEATSSTMAAARRVISPAHPLTGVGERLARLPMSSAERIGVLGSLRLGSATGTRALT